MVTRDSSSPIPIRPSQILDPNSERVTSVGGVRQHAHLAPVPARTEIAHLQSQLPATAFTASVEPGVQSARVRGFPLASTILCVVGQMILAVAIAVGTVGPVFGAVASGGLVVCGLALVVAQTATYTSDRA